MKGKKNSKENTDYLDDPELFCIKIGKRIKALRLRNGYTNQEDFANDKGLDRAQYGRYERGVADLRMSSFGKVLAALEVSPGEFFGEGF